MPSLLVLSFGSLVGSLRGLHYAVPSTLGRWGNGHYGGDDPQLDCPLVRMGKGDRPTVENLTP